MEWVLQKGMKQGRNVHGIPSPDACSDRTNMKGVWPHWEACLFLFIGKVSNLGTSIH